MKVEKDLIYMHNFFCFVLKSLGCYIYIFIHSCLYIYENISFVKLVVAYYFHKSLRVDNIEIYVASPLNKGRHSYTEYKRKIVHLYKISTHI